MIDLLKKLLCVFLLMMILANVFSGIASAISINSAKIINLGDCGYHLQYWDESRNLWSYIITTLVGYKYDGSVHYAYCLNRDAHGVGTVDSYNVDVNTLLDNVQIWRTITAGFPYRTAEQLGCSTNEDAFVATKQAVYCIIYGFNPETRYRGGDARGEQIKNAIINLTNEGKNGTRTPQSANIKINKIGDLETNGSYCYQEMGVSSFVNIGNYTVKDLKGLPSGSKIVNMKNSEQDTFGGTEHFKIGIPKDKIIDDINVSLSVKAKCETYPVFLGKAPSGDLQDYALTFDSMSDEHGSIDFKIDAHKASIKVIKEDSKQKYRISGVVFNFKYSDGTNIGNFTTDKNGEILVSKLKPGTVVITELKTGENYVLNDGKVEIKLSYADEKVQSILNERIKGRLKITKIDANDENKKIEGVKFGIFDKNYDLVQTIITDKNGIAEANNLYKGKYYAKETSTSSPYYLIDENEFEFEIAKNGDVIEKTIKNIPTNIKVDVDKKGSVEIQPGEDVNYEFSNIINKSNVYLDNFRWIDYIPSDFVRLENIDTGTWNQNLNYNVYYKTNKSNKYVLFAENLNTMESHNLNFSDLKLNDDEYIIETMFDFGKVQAGFKESVFPKMQCKSLNTIKKRNCFY